MGTRAMWKGRLVLGNESVGCKLYAAVRDLGVHFHLLHGKDGVRVQQRLAHPETGRTVPTDRIRRGVEVERGRYILVDGAELSGLEPAASRDIEIMRFVAPDQVDHRWYERPYYLGPDAGQVERYFALVEALANSGLQGIARWTMRKQEYVGALRLHEGWLALVSLHHADEVIAARDLKAPPGREPDARERKLAAQLVAALAGPFEPDQFEDEYRKRVLELVARKQKGGKVRLRRYRSKPVGDGSLVEVLRRSLRAAG